MLNELVHLSFFKQIKLYWEFKSAEVSGIHTLLGKWLPKGGDVLEIGCGAGRDAAHIIPDSEGGEPVVQNGLSLCKIHHAAFDNNILGISPDYHVRIREDILAEVDGPMLKWGLQEMNGVKLYLPNPHNRPNRDWLDERFQRFVR